MPNDRRRLAPWFQVCHCLLQAATVTGIVAVAIVGATPPTLGGAIQAAVTVVRGGTLIDGTGRASVPNAAVVITGDRITAVGPVSQVTIPPGATIVDAEGQYVIPGLVDTHVHYRDWLGEMFLAHGVTSVFDLGDPSDWILALREASAQGTLRGPRLFVSGNIIDGLPEGDRAAMGGASAGSRNRRNRTLVDGPSAARRETRALIDRGVDFIKIYQDLRTDELAAVAEEAHRAGLAVLGHTYDTRAAAEAGLDVVTHLWGVASTLMSPDRLKAYHAGEVASPYPSLGSPDRAGLARTLADRHVFVNPLLINEHAGVNAHTLDFQIDVHRLLGDPALRYVPDDPRLGLLLMFTKVRNYATRLGSFPPLAKLAPEVQAEFREGYKQAQGFVRDFAAAGGKLLVGSDSAGASVTPGLSVHHEMRLLVDAGLSPMEALRGATQYAGELVARRDGIGTIEPGKRADLVLLRDDPLADIANTQHIVSVIKDGRVVDTSYHPHYTSPIPYPIDEFSSSYVPAPSLGEISPMSVPAGSVDLRLTVTGSGFYLTAIVLVGGEPVPTTFVSPSRIEAVVPAALLREVGTLRIVVSNPRPGGGESNGYGLVVAPRQGGAR